MELPFLDIHTHQDKYSENILSVQNFNLATDDVSLVLEKSSVSLGVHPWYSEVLNYDKLLSELSTYASLEQIKMIGECGLDKLKGAPLATQIQLFSKQVQLADRVKKPVIIHCVRAYEELISIHKVLKPTVPMIIHGFNKNIELARMLTKHGFFLSFGSSVLKSESVQNVVKNLDSIFFLETDDSLLAIEEIYQKVADIKQILLDDLKSKIFANWKSIKLI